MPSRVEFEKLHENQWHWWWVLVHRDKCPKGCVPGRFTTFDVQECCRNVGSGIAKNCLQHSPSPTRKSCHQMSVVVCQDYLLRYHVIPSFRFCCLCLLCSLGRAVLAGPTTHFPRHSFRLLHIQTPQVP